MQKFLSRATLANSTFFPGKLYTAFKILVNLSTKLVYWSFGVEWSVKIFLSHFFKVFQVAYVIIKSANAPRPGNWILERSIDGTEFKPWQYYAISDTECLTRYNITPRVGPPTYKRDDEVICTSYYSRLVPLEHGEVYLFLHLWFLSMNSDLKTFASQLEFNSLSTTRWSVIL